MYGLHLFLNNAQNVVQNYYNLKNLAGVLLHLYGSNHANDRSWFNGNCYDAVADILSIDNIPFPDPALNVSIFNINFTIYFFNNR